MDIQVFTRTEIERAFFRKFVALKFQDNLRKQSIADAEDDEEEDDEPPRSKLTMSEPSFSASQIYDMAKIHSLSFLHAPSAR